MHAVLEGSWAGASHLKLLLQTRDGGVLLCLDLCEGQAGLLQAPGSLLCPPHGIGQLFARRVQLDSFVALFRVNVVRPLFASKPEFCHFGEIRSTYVQFHRFQ
jgi:hypothetical protein